jgi:dienelactone hydrolase
MRSSRLGVVLAAALALPVGLVPGATQATAPGVARTLCDVPAATLPDPSDPSYNAAWAARDAQNMLCGTQKVTVDQFTPSYIVKANTELAADYPNTILGQVSRQSPSVPVWVDIPGATVSDPFRMPAEWEAAGRGHSRDFFFLACNGAKLSARVFWPAAAPSASGYPAIVQSTGAVQAFKEIYFWAAEGLAENGYVVLTYDVVGQGQSDISGNATYARDDCVDTSPYSQGMRDGLRYIRSNSDSPYTTAANATATSTSQYNPLGHDIDLDRIGIEGHSAGAAAVSQVGQEDPNVKAIVAWDCLGAQAPENTGRIHAPALGICSEYGFWVQPTQPGTSRDFKSAAFKQLSGKDDLSHPTVDTMLVIPRASTHLEYDYVPYLFTATRYGERVAFYYTRAWMDRYVKGDTSATQRLTATTFDDSADTSSIGAGTYDLATNSNVPYKIAGDCISNRLSFYYNSRYWLDGGALSNDDMQETAPVCPLTANRPF